MKAATACRHLVRIAQALRTMGIKLEDHLLDGFAIQVDEQLSALPLREYKRGSEWTGAHNAIDNEGRLWRVMGVLPGRRSIRLHKRPAHLLVTRFYPERGRSKVLYRGPGHAAYELQQGGSMQLRQLAAIKDAAEQPDQANTFVVVVVTQHSANARIMQAPDVATAAKIAATAARSPAKVMAWAANTAQALYTAQEGENGQLHVVRSR